ncbi:metallophosphoesterase family protein [Paenibacillus sp. FSL W7-1287]|uniref:metallophosphoesterase family protein n=1 Tax=Paenibacillus sp. FSL W7-1287 TaxID=2954538 RepID=UPI0030F69523
MISNERLIFSFQVITDTHITIDPAHQYNKHLDLALRDIIAQCPESKGIMHIGDVTDHGFHEEYDQFQRIWNQHKKKLPPLYITTGNHDVGLPESEEQLQQLWEQFKNKFPAHNLSNSKPELEIGSWEDRSGRFLERIGNSALYHDHWINGYHFIFLSTEQGLPIYCSLSSIQLEWLKQRLAEEATPEKPIFLFLHQPLKNTVAGSLEHQNWYGVIEDEKLKLILSNYPQVVMFSGHSHWELGAPYTYNDSAPAMFNAASVAYLWTDEDEFKYGSQGYYVDVYNSKVVVRGRNFVNQSWVNEAHFTIKYK